MVETHFYRQGELAATLRHQDGEAIFGGPDPDTARSIIEEITVATDDGILAFDVDPERWLRLVPGELRSPYLSALVAEDDHEQSPPTAA